MAANAGTGMRNIGMAFWGGRVTLSQKPFDAVFGKTPQGH